ncbi:MarR family transcriptional regulator [Streptomyces sp. NPDC017448]|uniref:MarR family transcriptional regulator n=1 Tax=Streptomyces sp. NPDC017448 TaxID=3364996 RepID=UPI003792D751
MANPGYGKRSAPGQQPRSRDDFALLPTRERYVAGFIDHLPEGAAMSVKQLAKQLPLYGQQAIGTSLSSLSVAGHLRRVRCPVGDGEQVRWVYRTFWSRTARDNEWWNTYLATENAVQAVAPAGPETPRSDAPPPPWAPTVEPPTPGATAEEPPKPPAQSDDATAEWAPDPTDVPQQRTPLPTSDAPQPQHTKQGPLSRGAVSAAPVTPTPPPPAPGEVPAALRAATGPEPSPAYLALARLGRDDHRLALSANDCATLEPLATRWLARGVSVDYLTNVLTAGLPEQIDSPAGLLRHRLTDKMPPQLPTAGTMSPASEAPAPSRRILMECTTCGRPGPAEALPDGLCHPCHHTHNGSADTTPTTAEIAAVKAHMATLRTLLKPV